MHPQLVEAVSYKIRETAMEVCSRLHIDMETDELYEELMACYGFDTPIMLREIKAATKYLPANGVRKTCTLTTAYNVNMDTAMTIDLEVRLHPTEKWPSFIFPDKPMMLTQWSKLAEKLALPMRVAGEWSALTYVWSQFSDAQFNLDAAVLGKLMPWLRDVMSGILIPKTKYAADRAKMFKDRQAILDDTEVKSRPRMSKELAVIARSGRHLFGQWNMMQASLPFDRETIAPKLKVSPRASNPPWLSTHMAETRAEWYDEELARKNLKLQTLRKSQWEKWDNSGE